MKIRPVSVEDRDAILRVHVQAIRRGAASHYSPQQTSGLGGVPRAGFDSIHVSASLNSIPFHARTGFDPQVELRYELPGGHHLRCMFMTKQVTAAWSGGKTS